MQKCVNDECEYFKQYGECSSVCVKNGFNKIITNFDRIKNMTIEEMAEKAVYELRIFIMAEPSYMSLIDGTCYSTKELAITHNKEFLGAEVK